MKHISDTFRYLGVCGFPRLLQMAFGQRRECERIAVDIAMACQLDKAWVNSIVLRAYAVAMKSPRWTGMDLMERLDSKVFLGRLKADPEILRDPERAIPEEWA